jgi:hypothetical protein
VDSVKKIHTQLRNYSLLALLLFTHHRKGLAGSRLTVGKDTNVVSYKKKYKKKSICNEYIINLPFFTRPISLVKAELNKK